MYLVLFVRHAGAELLPRVDGHAGVVVHRAELLEAVHRDAGAPGLQLARLLLLHGLLLGCRLAAPAAAASAAALAAPARAGNRAGFAVPHAGQRFGRRVVRTSPAASATAAAARRRAREALDRPAHQLDRADAGVHDVLQDSFRALISHQAPVAVRDRADLDAVDERVRLCLRKRSEDRFCVPKRHRGRHSSQRELSELTPRQHDSPSCRLRIPGGCRADVVPPAF